MRQAFDLSGIEERTDLRKETLMRREQGLTDGCVRIVDPVADLIAANFKEKLSIYGDKLVLKKL